MPKNKKPPPITIPQDLELDKLTIEEIKNHIASLPERQRFRVLAIAASIRNMMQTGGDEATLALTLVGAEMALEIDREVN